MSTRHGSVWLGSESHHQIRALKLRTEGSVVINEAKREKGMGRVFQTEGNARAKAPRLEGAWHLRK